MKKPPTRHFPIQDHDMSRIRHTDEEKARIIREFEHHKGTECAKAISPLCPHHLLESSVRQKSGIMECFRQ
jgi:hypothetical protein